MEITLEQLGTSAGISLFFGTLVFIAARYYIERQINSDFDIKLQNIKKEHDLELAKFQAEINHLKSQENFKFTKLHEKRFEVLGLIYKNLIISLGKLEEYISPLKPSNDYMENEDLLRKKYLEANTEFLISFLPNQIFLNENIIKLIGDYRNKIYSIFHDYSFNHDMRKAGENPGAEITKDAYTAYKRIPEQIYPIIKEVEKEFKTIFEDIPNLKK